MDRRINFSFQSVLHNFCNKSHGVCYPVCGIVHIKEPLLVIKKTVAYVVAAGLLFRYLNGPLPYVQYHITVNEKCAKLNISFLCFNYLKK